MRDSKRTQSGLKPQSTRRRLGFLALAAVSGVAASVTGCISDPDCGICDPDNLVLEIMSGPNYQGDQIWILSPDCEGPECPTEKLTTADYFVNQVSTCEESEAANRDSVSRTPEEYCKVAPIVVLGGEYQLEFIFNNLLDPESIELVRKQIDDPQRLEVYDWKNRLANIEGPISRFNGDYVKGASGEGFMERAVNLSCIDNISAAGILGNTPYHEKLAEDPFLCDTVDVAADGTPTPRKLQSGEMPSFTGLTSNLGFDCENPVTEGAEDNCCTATDHILSISVAKYGVSEEGNADTLLTSANALQCDPAGDVYQQCRDFVPYVDRSGDPTSYDYDFDGDGVISAEERGQQVPRYDRLRSLHPDDRPKDGNGNPLWEQRNIPCAQDNDCEEGAACVGFDSNGLACSGGADCADLRCTQEWFVECDDDTNTTGTQGYCRDKRYKDRSAGACFESTVPFTVFDEEGNPSNKPAGTRLSACDTDRNGVLTAEECCLPELGGGPNCDPIYDQLAALTPRPIYDRDFTLPAEARCYCGPGQNESCTADVEKFCAAPYGTGSVPANTYIQRPVSRVGGVIYDPAVKGLAYRPADLGNYSRARVEALADNITPVLIGDTGVIDGWQMSESGRGAVERAVDYDAALCSGSEYRMVFETREGEQVLKDKVGNSLRFKNTYVFETPQFHVDITNRKPLNNLTIGPCTDFDLGFSNKYDLDPENLRKLQLWNIEYTPGDDPRCTDSGDISESNPTCFSFVERVAGGLDCTVDDVAAVEAGTSVPCLKISSYFAREGLLNFKVDDAIFGPRLFPESSGGSGWYRLVVPGLHEYAADGVPLQETGWDSLDDLWADSSVSDTEKQDIYRSAFQDSCGMPLVTAGLRDAEARPDFWYDIQIDNAACKDDDDFDGIESSCDNASSYFNPDQNDADLDGFGDVEDKCAVTATPQNTGDADKDSIGDDCDTCSRQPNNYNTLEGAEDVINATPYMRIRNVPLQQDSDQDGIGDACDNCPTVPNCESFGPVADGLTPWVVNTPINSQDGDICQVDKEDSMGTVGGNWVGDICDGQQPNPDAAGVIGMGPDDDFDQDGIANASDYCPRFPYTPIACTADTDCSGGTTSLCVNGFCDNHFDSDNDQVGNICDNCPQTPNPDQNGIGGPSEGDPDNDFVGNECEPQRSSNSQNPRPYSFREVSAFGRCCSLTYIGDGEYIDDSANEYGNGTGFVCISPERGGVVNGIMCSPDGVPVKQVCDNPPAPGTIPVPDGTTCVSVPSELTDPNSGRPGVVFLPAGCEAALAAAGITAEENVRLSLDDVGGDAAELWSKMCFDPQWDQDFDGVLDFITGSTDLCPFFFDPDNQPYISPDTGAIDLNTGAKCPPAFIDDTLRCQAQVISGGGEDGGGDTTGG